MENNIRIKNEYQCFEKEVIFSIKLVRKFNSQNLNFE